MSDSPDKPPPFPYVAAALWAACVGAAAWTWMRYSYSWTVSPASLESTSLRAKDEQPMTRWPVGRYAFLSGFIYPTKGIQWSAQHVEGLIFFKRFTYGSGTAPFSEEDIVVRFVEEESPLFVRL